MGRGPEDGERRPKGRRLRCGLAPAIALAACAPAPPADPALSRFGEDTLVSGRVVENVPACRVDAVCYLRLEFADTTVVAHYGWGERPAPPCEIPPEVSDEAFRVEAGDVVDVVVSMCDAEGPYLRRIARETG